MIALSTTSKFLFLFKTQKVVFGEGGGGSLQISTPDGADHFCNIHFFLKKQHLTYKLMIKYVKLG